MSTPIKMLQPTDCAALEALTQQHLIWLQVMQYSPFTVINRRSNLRQFLCWSAGEGVVDLCQLKPAVIHAFREAIANWRRPDGNRLCIGGQVQKLLALKMFLKWLLRQGYLSTDLSEELEFPRRRQRLPRAVMNAAEVERVLSIPDCSKPTGLRDRAILETFYATGIRRSELTRLHCTDVDRDRGTVLVLEGKGGKDRVVPISERALLWIEEYSTKARSRLVRARTQPHLFLTSRGNSMPPKRLTELVHNYVSLSGISKIGSCHMFRHAVATLMLEGGADIRYIQEMLGHSQLATTAIYTRVSITRLRQVYRRTHPAYRAASSVLVAEC